MLRQFFKANIRVNVFAGNSQIENTSIQVVDHIVWPVVIKKGVRGFEEKKYYIKLNNSSVALVRERTIPTERPPPVGEVSANFCG